MKASSPNCRIKPPQEECRLERMEAEEKEYKEQSLEDSRHRQLDRHRHRIINRHSRPQGGISKTKWLDTLLQDRHPLD